MLAAHEVSFAVGRQTIVDRVSVEVRPGELLAIVGPNGAGKSTLLQLLTGDLKPTGGEVTLMKRPLSDWSRTALAQRRGVLMQQNNLTFAFTVQEVVLMGRMPHNGGVETTADYEIVSEALQSVGLADFADRVYLTLSGGEKQRVHLARILAQIWRAAPDGERLLLLDEPTASLDIVYQQQVLQIARQFADAKTAVCAILHDLNLAAHYADRIIMLKAGRALYAGPPEQVLLVDAIQHTFDAAVMVIPHPATGNPLVTYLPETAAVSKTHVHM